VTQRIQVNPEQLADDGQRFPLPAANPLPPPAELQPAASGIASAMAQQVNASGPGVGLGQEPEAETIWDTGTHVPAQPAKVTEIRLPPEVLAARNLEEKPQPKEATGPTIFGEDLISERSLDEVILGYLAGDGDEDE
jgi:hypothetical protein